MLTILAVGVMVISLGLYYRKSLTTDFNKYKTVVNTYRTQYPDMNRVVAYIKAILLILKCKWIMTYQSYTSVSIPNYTLVKYVTGGKYQCCVIPIQRGPKPQLEYGYIDHVPMTELFQVLCGIDHMFSGHSTFLLELGNHIRYKFSDQDEIVLEKEGNENKKKENLKKINNFYMTSS